MSEICKEFTINKEAVIKKGMKRNKARDMAISPEITAEWLGNDNRKTMIKVKTTD